MSYFIGAVMGVAFALAGYSFFESIGCVLVLAIPIALLVSLIEFLRREK